MLKNQKLIALTLAIFLALIPIQFGLPLVVDFFIIAIAYLAMFFVVKNSELSLNALKLSRNQLKRSAIPIASIAVLIFSSVFIFYLFQPSAFTNDKYETSLAEILLYILLLLPFQVAVLEELLFRGIIFSSLQTRFSTKYSALFSSILFGFWHIPSSRNFESDLTPNIFGSFESVVVIAAIVFFTTLAGLLFCYLREKFESLYLPIVFHWSVNASFVLMIYLNSL